MIFFGSPAGMPIPFSVNQGTIPNEAATCAILLALLLLH
jgi:hypothetical protein